MGIAPPLDQGPAEQHTSHDQPPIPTAEVLEVLRTLGIKGGQQQRGQAELPGQATSQVGDCVGCAARQHPGQQRDQQRDQQRPQPAG